MTLLQFVVSEQSDNSGTIDIAFGITEGVPIALFGLYFLQVDCRSHMGIENVRTRL